MPARLAQRVARTLRELQLAGKRGKCFIEVTIVSMQLGTRRSRAARARGHGWDDVAEARGEERLVARARGADARARA